MKSFIYAAAFSLAATGSQAGGLADAVMEAPMPVVIVEEEPASSIAGWVIPLILVALIVAASQDDDDPNSNQLSDSRLKTDITPLGTSPSGLPIYSFRYIGDPALYEGVMAQDVLAHTPQAVGSHPLGVLTVDYGQIDVDMRRID